MYSCAEYLKLPAESTPWLWRGLLPRSGSASLYGDPKVGKSYVALGLAEAVAAWRPTYLGLPVEQHGNVVYVQLDTPRGLWRDQYVRYVGELPNLFIIDREQEDLPRRFDLRDLVQADWLRKQVEAVDPVLLVFDTLRKLHFGNEDKSDDMRLVLDSVRDVAGNAAVLLLSHASKPSEERGHAVVTGLRGSGELAASVDAVWHLAAKVKPKAVNDGKILEARFRVAARSDVDGFDVVRSADGFWFRPELRDEIGTFVAMLPRGDARIPAIASRFMVTPATAAAWLQQFS